jgi:threonylcarbamoyladenosine tRNA methylthiotransferase MtaB
MKFHVVNLGCKVNRVESDSVAAGLLHSGHALVESNADLVVVNTCTVTAEADKKARKAVRHAISLNPNAKMVVTGCAAAIHPHAFEAIDDRISVVPKFELESYIAKLGSDWESGSSQASNVCDADAPLRTGSDFNTRVSIKIQDGCNNSCTYCIVHVARGRERSMPFEKVLSEVVSYARSGTREIVLTGINIGSYSDGGRGLSSLLRSLLEATKNLPDESYPVRFRISSIEPEDVDDELIELISNAEGRICRHLHLALQSGSSKVLLEMNRNYSAQDYIELVDRICETIPEMSLSTDVIVGFPGETDEDFQQTIDLATYCRFTKIHVFPYSRREGTPAAERVDQVPDNVKKDRASKLRKLSAALRESDFERRKGTTELALVEPDFAMTESYHEVELPFNAENGQLIPVTIGDSVKLHARK